MAEVRVENTAVSPTPDEAFDDALTSTLPWAGAGAAVVLLGAAGLAGTELAGAERLAVVAVTSGSALLAAALGLAAHVRRVPPRLAHLAGALLVWSLVVPAVTHMVVAAQPARSLLVVVAVAGAGALVLALRWLLVVLYVAWGAWVVGAFFVGPSPQWPLVVSTLAAATVLSLGVNHLRRTSARELADAHAAAAAAAVRDHLTGLANRRGLAMVGGQLVENARRQGDAVHCLFVDIDGLKSVNDALGHAAGDEVIVAVGEVLRGVTRATDVVARWGGDEFCLLGPGPGMPPLELERRVRDTLAAQPPVPAEVWSGRVNAGGSMLAPWDAGSLETLLAKADQEMYLRRSLRPARGAPLRAPGGDRVTD